jgi:hypothetical protein
MPMKKVRHDKALKIEHEGQRWTLDAAEWNDGQRGELRVYRVHGDITSPLLAEALEVEAQDRGLALCMAGG